MAPVSNQDRGRLVGRDVAHAGRARGCPVTSPHLVAIGVVDEEVHQIPGRRGLRPRDGDVRFPARGGTALCAQRYNCVRIACSSWRGSLACSDTLRPAGTWPLWRLAVYIPGLAPIVL